MITENMNCQIIAIFTELFRANRYTAKLCLVKGELISNLAATLTLKKKIISLIALKFLKKAYIY